MTAQLVNANTSDQILTGVVDLNPAGGSGIHLGSGVVLTAGHLLFDDRNPEELARAPSTYNLISAGGTVQAAAITGTLTADDFVALGNFEQEDGFIDLALVYTAPSAELFENSLIIFDDPNDTSGEIGFLGFPDAENIGNGTDLYFSGGTISENAVEDVLYEASGFDFTTRVLTSDIGTQNVGGFSGSGVYLNTTIDSEFYSGIIGVVSGSIVAPARRDLTFIASLSDVYQSLADEVSSEGFVADDFATNTLIASLDGELQGTFFNELILGTDLSDTIHAAGGNDEIRSGQGSDTIFGGTGSDIISLGGSVSGDEDTIHGDGGVDTVVFDGTYSSFIADSEYFENGDYWHFSVSGYSSFVHTSEIFQFDDVTFDIREQADLDTLLDDIASEVDSDSEPSENSPPMAAAASISGDEDTEITGTLAATDADDDALSYSLASDPSNGTVSVAPDGSFSYTPNADFNGIDSFTYRVSDGNSGTATETVAITVEAVNDAPVASSITLIGDEDTVLAGTLIATDLDLDGLTFSQVSSPSNGIVSIANNGAITYTPDTNFNGTNSFTYRVSDNVGGTAIETVNITVEAVNDAPVASSITLTGDEDTLLTGTLFATDIDLDGLTFSQVSSPSNGIVSIANNGALTYTPDANFSGTNSFTYRVSDNVGGTAIETVNITVEAVNDAPVASSITLTGYEDTVLTGILAATDVDGDALTYSLASGPSNGTASLTDDGAVTFTPTADFNGTDSFAYSVSDGNGGMATETVTITVEAVNDAPVTSSITLTGDEDTVLTGTLIATDIDLDAFTFSQATSPSNGIASVANDGSVTYTPNADFNGSDSFVFRVSDNIGGTTTETVNITVEAVNDLPMSSSIMEADGDVRTTFYDASGARESLVFEDGSNSRNWESYTNTYDTATGRISTQELLYDNGNTRGQSYTDGNLSQRVITGTNGDVRTTLFNPNGERESLTVEDGSDARSWEISTTTYDAATGKIIAQELLYDNGNSRNQSYIDGNLSRRVITETDGDVRTTFLNSDGERERLTVEDGSDTRSWETSTTIFDTATDEIIAQELLYDNGSSRNQSYIDGVLSQRVNTQIDGDVRTTFYDANGLRESVTVEDFSSSRNWESFTDTYDANGMFLTREYVYDL